MNLENLCLKCMNFSGEKDMCPFCGQDRNSASEDHHLNPGTILEGRYLVGVPFSEDEFFISYIGWDIDKSRKLVIKEFFPKNTVSRNEKKTVMSKRDSGSLSSFRSAVQKILDEVKLISSLDRNSGVINIIDCFTFNGTVYTVRLFFEGEKLRDRINVKKTKYTVSEAAALLKPVIDDMSLIHRNGFYHGNINPGKIYLCSDGSVKLTDFSSSAYLFSGTSRSAFIEDGYAAPEQYDDSKKKDFKTDIYSIAATIFRMVYGIRPQSATNRILCDNLSTPEKFNLFKGTSAEKALFKALSIDPEKRFSSLDNFYRELTSDKRQNFKTFSKPSRYRNIILITIIFIAGIAGGMTAGGIFKAKNETVNNEVKEMTPATVTVMRLSGSNTIGQKLAPMLSEAFLRKSGAVSVVTVKDPDSPSSSVEGILNGKKVQISIKAFGSSNAFKDLGTGDCDIGMSSRKVKPDEEEKLAQLGLGDIASIRSEHIIGTDGIAVIVNKGNPLSELNVETISEIFSGKITNWKELGGPPLDITLYSRDGESGTHDTFNHLVMKKNKLSASVKNFNDNASLSDEVSKDLSGIGYTGLPYINNSKALAVSEESSHPLYPTVFSVSTEDYILSRRLYLYSRQVSQNDITDGFIEFVQSAQGQEIVEKAGFISQTPKLESPVIPGNVPEEYRVIANNNMRLSLNIRFKMNSSAPDNKAMRDIERFLQFLELSSNRNRKIILVGFSDSTGDEKICREISIQRAESVAEILKKYGIAVETSGFGKAVPVATNLTEDGRNLNRRVEIWVSK